MQEDRTTSKTAAKNSFEKHQKLSAVFKIGIEFQERNRWKLLEDSMDNEMEEQKN